MSNNRKERGVPPYKKAKIDVGTSQVCERNTAQKSKLGFRASDNKNGRVVTKEIENRRDNRVNDGLTSNDEVSTDCADSDSSTGESIELSDDINMATSSKRKVYVRRKKIILEEKGVNELEVLPLDWVMIQHQSGMPVYLHRATQVCTFSKPFFLGKANAKKHNIPISAIPCLAYRRALEKAERQELIAKTVEEQIEETWAQGTGSINHNGMSQGVCPFERAIPQSTSNEAEEEHSSSNQATVLVKNGSTKKFKRNEPYANTNKLSDRQSSGWFRDIDIGPQRAEITAGKEIQHLTHDQVNDYCKRLFKFKVLNIMRPKRWAVHSKLEASSRSPTQFEVPELVASSMQSTSIPNSGAGEAGGGGGGGGGGRGGGGSEREFSYLLAQQLDRQHAIYEDRIAKVEAERVARCLEARARAEAAEAEARALRQRMSALARDNRAKGKRLHYLTNRLASVQSELSEERGLGAALGAGQAQWQARARAREDAFRDEVTELKEQLRDVMFYVEARKELEKVQGGTAGARTTARTAARTTASARERQPSSRTAATRRTR